MIRCRTCNVIIDEDAVDFGGHGDHVLVHETPPPPTVDRKKIETHLRQMRAYLDSMAATGTPVTGHNIMIADLLEFVLKLEKDMADLRMASMGVR